jgi:thymidylate kinase
MDRRPVIVGLCPRRDCLEPLSPDYPSGRRLATMCGMTPDEFRKSFIRINLHNDPDGGDDVKAAKRIAPDLEGRRVIALGGRVAKALNLPKKSFTWTLGMLDDGFSKWRFVGAKSPHPSGRSRWWNDAENRGEAMWFFSSINGPCIHVEGTDGSGKSTLVERIGRNEALDMLPTENPPKSWEECLRRIQLRVDTGIVCDRSSGLVSELVYGPVIRGATITAREEMEKVLLSLKHVVRFVYCRPPLDSIRHVAREDEDPEHVSAVEIKIVSLLSAYDRLFEWMEERGMEVIRYDWTTDDVNGVIKKCVE